MLFLCLFMISYAVAFPSGLVLTPARLTTYQFPIQSQYHAQDEHGQYSYGYNSPLSSKNEIRTADGITRGGYAYLDANGFFQNVQYTADALNGFRVSASNLPQPPVANLVPPQPVHDTPEVEQAKLNHLRAVQQQIMEISSTAVAPTILPTIVPTVRIPLPQLRVAYPTPVIVPTVSSQYHSQNQNGQYSYGYANQVGLPRDSGMYTRNVPNYLVANDAQSTSGTVNEPAPTQPAAEHNTSDTNRGSD